MARKQLQHAGTVVDGYADVLAAWAAHDARKLAEARAYCAQHGLETVADCRAFVRARLRDGRLGQRLTTEFNQREPGEDSQEDIG